MHDNDLFMSISAARGETDSTFILRLSAYILWLVKSTTLIMSPTLLDQYPKR